MASHVLPGVCAGLAATRLAIVFFTGSRPSIAVVTGPLPSGLAPASADWIAIAVAALVVGSGMATLNGPHSGLPKRSQPPDADMTPGRSVQRNPAAACMAVAPSSGRASSTGLAAIDC